MQEWNSHFLFFLAFHLFKGITVVDCLYSYLVALSLPVIKGKSQNNETGKQQHHVSLYTSNYLMSTAVLIAHGVMRPFQSYVPTEGKDVRESGLNMHFSVSSNVSWRKFIHVLPSQESPPTSSSLPRNKDVCRY